MRRPFRRNALNVVMSSTPAGTAQARTNSILSPVVDFLCVGGCRSIVFVPLLASGRSDLVIIGAGAQAWFATLINMPHFMASYRLVYRSRETIMRHRWASIYIPLILIVYIGVGALGSAAIAGARVDSDHGVERLSRLALHRAGVGNDGVLRLPRTARASRRSSVR